MCAFWRRSAPLEPRLAASMRAGAAPALLVAPWSGFASGLCPSRSPLGAQRAPRPPAIDVLPHDQPIGACLRYAKTCVCYSILQSAPRQVRQALIRWLPQIGVPRGARPLAGGAGVAAHPAARRVGDPHLAHNGMQGAYAPSRRRAGHASPLFLIPIRRLAQALDIADREQPAHRLVAGVAVILALHGRHVIGPQHALEADLAVGA